MYAIFPLNRRFGFRREVRGGVLLPEAESSPLQVILCGEVRGLNLRARLPQRSLRRESLRARLNDRSWCEALVEKKIVVDSGPNIRKCQKP